MSRDFKVADLGILRYNGTMPETGGTAVQRYKEQVKVEQILAVKTLQVKESLNVEDACEKIGLPVRTFYQWLSDDVFTDFLTEARQSLQSLAASYAVEALPAVMDYMVGLATGQKNARGASPIAAAKLVIEIAERYTGRGVSQQKGQATYAPQQVAILIQGGTPQVDEEGRIVIDAAPKSPG